MRSKKKTRGRYQDVWVSTVYDTYETNMYTSQLEIYKHKTYVCRLASVCRAVVLYTCVRIDVYMCTYSCIHVHV